MTKNEVPSRLLPYALAAGLAVLCGPARSEPPSDVSVAARAGAATFKTHCASCHGEKGRGDGPMADQLRFAPADLTRIARRNRGRFDADRAFRIIDGRSPLKGHGGTDMPIWGDAFLESQEGYSADSVRQKISELVQYLSSIQQ